MGLLNYFKDLIMTNNVTYYPTAKWASIEGAFTADELREIADKIDDPKLREDGKDGDKD